jgi:very-short-patch-repair endonuclease
VNPYLAGRASLQGGTFSRQDALEAGYTAAEVRSRLDAGTWLRLRRGRYVDATIAGAPGGSPDAYRLTCWAAVCAVDGSAVVSHNSAALVHGLDLHPDARRKALDLVELVLPDGSSRRRPGLITHDLHLADDERTKIEGLPITTLERTAIDVASTETSINATITVDSLLRRWGQEGLSNREAKALLEHTAERWPRKAQQQIARTVALADGLSESAGESLSRVTLIGQGLPTPWLQYVVGDFRADFAWPEFRTLGEFDGRLKYTDPSVLWAEKLREDALRDAGWELVRWTWAQITSQPAYVAQRLRSAFDRGLRRAG